VGSNWYLLVFLIAAIVTLVATPLVTRLARRFNLIDYPDGRRVNETPVPRPGGIALYLGILVSLAVFALCHAFDTEKVQYGLSSDINYFGVALAATVIFGVGLIDDIRPIRVRYKLLGQIAAAIIACFSGALFSHIANPFQGGVEALGIWSYPVTIFYLVAFANIINLIDGLDGLAAGIVAISSASLFIIALGKGGFDAALLAVALAGSCIAFLRYNSHPARIFMGDSGALLLGFLLGVMSLFGLVRTPALITLAVPVVIAGVPVVDTFAAIIRRLRARKSITEADTEHIHHRFLAIGYDQRTTVYILYVLSGLLSVCALLLMQYTGWVRWAILVVLLALMSLLVIRLGLMTPVLTHYYNKRVVTRNEASPGLDEPDGEKDQPEVVAEDQPEPESKPETEDQPEPESKHEPKRRPKSKDKSVVQ